MRRPNAAETLAALALFVSLGGVSWAAVTLPRNSVTSAAIRDGQVTGADLAKGSVSPGKLSKSLRARLGVTTASDGKNGASGAAGATGASGASGAPGKDGAPGRDGAGLAFLWEPAGEFAPTVHTAYLPVGSTSWQQEAGSVVEIRGTYLVERTNTSCSPGAMLFYRLVVDGKVVSQNWGNDAALTAQQEISSVNAPGVIPIPTASYHPATDRGSLAAEIPVTGTGNHTLVMEVRRASNTQCAAALREIQLYGVRFTR